MIEAVQVKEAIFESAKAAFETMIFLPMEQTDLEDIALETEASAVASITFTGEIEGCFFAQCHINTAESVARSMLMMEPQEEISKEMLYDALGEMVNLILGGLKAKLSDKIGELNISIPTSIIGNQLRPVLGKEAEKVNLIIRVKDGDIKLAMIYRKPRV